jgi:hypothetical protein
MRIEVLTANEHYSALMGCGKTLLAVVAIRKYCGSASARNPTANTAVGRVLRSQHSFSSDIRVNLRSFAVK